MLSKITPLKVLVRLFLFISIAGVCLLTAIGFVSVSALTKAQAQARYEKYTKQITSQIGERMENYVGILYQARAFLLVRSEPTQAEWEAFFDNQGIFQGQSEVDAVGFARYMRGTQKQVEQELSKERSEPLKISPEGQRSEYLPLVNIAKANPTSSPPAFGFDLLSEPVRNAAITEARNTGSPALTAPVSLVPSGKRAVIMALPVYIEGNELYGFVTAVYYTDSFAEGLLDSDNGQFVTSIKDKTSEQEIYASPNQVKGTSTSRSDALKMGNREWMIAYSAQAQAYGDGRYIPYAVLFVGIVLIVGLLSASRLILRYTDTIIGVKKSHK